MLSAFWCPANTIHLEANSTGAVEIQFLPFDVGHRQCSILFINDKIGEFLYCIEANATFPLPSPMPVAESPHSIRISSAAAARSGRGAFGGDERVVYWKCEQNESFTEDLYIPLVNEARENAFGEYLKIICVMLSFISRLHFEFGWFSLSFSSKQSPLNSACQRGSFNAESWLVRWPVVPSQQAWQRWALEEINSCTLATLTQRGTLEKRSQSFKQNWAPSSFRPLLRSSSQQLSTKRPVR